jgi:cardiolipin synthase
MGWRDISPFIFHLATIVSVLLTLLFVSRVLRSPRLPAATMGWLMAIVFVPLVGIPLYLVFGERKLKSLIRKKGRMSFLHTAETYNHPVNTLLVSLGIPSCSENNQVIFHENGRIALDALLTLLKSARYRIDMAVFILSGDAIGKEILSLLERRAAQGVKVRLLLDGVGSFELPKTHLVSLCSAGVEVAWFNPVLHRPLSSRTNLRNHRKIIVADDEVVWSGGRNLAMEYIGPHCPGECWVDLSFTHRGDSVSTYCGIFEADWCFANDIRLEEEREYHSSESENVGKSRMQVVPSGPDVADDPVYAAILTACYKANSRILIVTPYYVPDGGLQEALKLAIFRGVQVDMVLPEKSNHRLADIARRRYLRELDAAGAKLWFFSDAMIHAKLLLVDNSFAMTGSANLDIRSLFLNCEVMTCFYGAEEVNWLMEWAEEILSQSRRHNMQSASFHEDMLEGLVLLGAYQL